MDSREQTSRVHLLCTVLGLGSPKNICLQEQSHEIFPDVCLSATCMTEAL